MTQCEIILRLVKGYGWLGIIYDKNGVEVYRTGTFHPTTTDAFGATDRMLRELVDTKRLD